MWSSTYLKERNCSLHHAPQRAEPLRTKRTRLRPRRRAAEPQQPSDSRRKLDNFLRLLARGCGGATRGAGAGGMNTTEDFIAGCLARDAHRPDADVMTV